MIIYFTKKYIVISLIIAILLIPFTLVSGIQSGILKTFIWAGLISGYLTYVFFRKNNLWVLYYNLRIPIFLTIGVNILIYETIVIIITLLIKNMVS